MSPEDFYKIAIGISIVALIVTIVNASFGILNIILSRCRLLKVREVVCYFSAGVNSGKRHVLEVDLLSYGAAIFDLGVEVSIFVRPSKEAIESNFVGTTRITLSPVGTLPNPLNAGKGVRFRAERPLVRDERKRWFDERAALAFKAARKRDICILVTCSDGRKVLKRLRSHRVLREIDEFLERPRQVGWRWWERIIGRVRVWWILRRSKKFSGTVPASNPESGDS